MGCITVGNDCRILKDFLQCEFLRPRTMSPDLTHIPELSFPHSSFQRSAESRRNSSVSRTTGRGGAVTCAEGAGLVAR